jgi:ribosome-interacting GTPase 1
VRQRLQYAVRWPGPAAPGAAPLRVGRHYQLVDRDVIELHTASSAT